MVIQTARLKLVLQTSEQVLAQIAALSPAEQAEVSPAWLEKFRSTTEATPWTHGFSLLDRASETVVGGCAFKGPPNVEGAVEIAYGVNPEFQGCGYATEAAQALVDFAWGDGGVQLVRAHTRSDNQASCRVLAKCGFELIGEVIDPEDGLVLRWEIKRTTE